MCGDCQFPVLVRASKIDFRVNLCQARNVQWSIRHEQSKRAQRSQEATEFQSAPSEQLQTIPPVGSHTALARASFPKCTSSRLCCSDMLGCLLRARDPLQKCSSAEVHRETMGSLHALPKPTDACRKKDPTRSWCTQLMFLVLTHSRFLNRMRTPQNSSLNCWTSTR